MSVFSFSLMVMVTRLHKENIRHSVFRGVITDGESG